MVDEREFFCDCIRQHEKSIYSLAYGILKNEEDAAVLLTHYTDADEGEPKEIALSLTGCRNVRVKVETLDETRDMAVTREETFTGENPVLCLTLPLFTTLLITITENN